MRGLVLGGVLIAALAVAGLAVRSQRLAEDAGAADRAAAALAEAERLAARSTTGPLDVSLLLAAQAVRLAETSETRARLAALLAEHPRVERVGRCPGFPRDPALSGGRTLTSVPRRRGRVVDRAGHPAGVILGSPRWGAWRSTPFPLESAVMGAGLLDGVPWLRVVSAVDGAPADPRRRRDRGVPVAGSRARTAAGSSCSWPSTDAAAPISSRWRVIEVDPLTGTRQDTGIRGTFPAPPLALVADFAHDAALRPLGRGRGRHRPRVDLDGGQTPLQVSSDHRGARPCGASLRRGTAVDRRRDHRARPHGTPSRNSRHGSAVYDVAVSPDGTWAVSAGGGGAVVLWGVEPSTGRWSRERLPVTWVASSGPRSTRPAGP